jgi:hypothetical protein
MMIEGFTYTRSAESWVLGQLPMRLGVPHTMAVRLGMSMRGTGKAGCIEDDPMTLHCT